MFEEDTQKIPVTGKMTGDTYPLVFERAPEAMGILNGTGELLECNEALHRLLGRNATGENLGDLPGDETTNVMNYVLREIQNSEDKPTSFELNLKTEHQGSRVVRVSLRRLDTGGESDRMVGVFYDITDWNRSQITLIQEFAFYSELEELGREINGQINLQQIALRTLECSQMHCDFVGAAVIHNDLDTEELTQGYNTLKDSRKSRELNQILCRENGPFHHLKDHLQKNASFKTTLYNLSHDDWDTAADRVYLQSVEFSKILAIPIRIGAEINGFLIGAVKDKPAESIDYRSRFHHLANLLSSAINNVILFHQIKGKNTELAKSLKELKRAELYRDQFYRFLIHDLNKPLASIVGTSNRLLSRYELSEEVKQRMERIHRSAERLRDYIGDMLSFEQMRRGEIEVKSAEFGFKQEVLEMAAMLLERYPEQKLIILQRIQQEWNLLPEAVVKTDAKHLQRIVYNLLDNAAKYGEGLISLDYSLKGDTLVVEVWNSGEAIPDNERTRIFDEFYRRNKTEDGHSSGIGLASVRYLVKALGGQVTFDSPLQGGNRFSIIIPSTWNPVDHQNTLKETRG
ncbi:MAG: PAS domain-containing sensor histidine kinase [Candidatus Sumerlaeia bacterium]|nr:PAS domain-containing sensor histidine kinase [Candidatus Sumerlaeia bacterium]